MLTRHRRLIPVLTALMAAGVLVMLVAGGVFWRAWTGGPATGSVSASHRVRIEPGMTLAAAADTLVRCGLLENRTVFLLGARLTGRERDLRAGLYAVPDPVSPRRLLELLTSGSTVQKKVTIPEGLYAEEVAALVADELTVPLAEFTAAADSIARAAVERLSSAAARPRFALLDSLITTVTAGPGGTLHWCEGYLAPDTYHFSEGVSAARVAEVLVTTQLARLDSALSLIGADTAAEPAGAPLDLDPHQLLTLASIVEAEARLDSERPLVAAVYVNRLKRGWRLEADPTVAFFLDKKGKRIFYKDLRRESPYNTYRNAGLPPGPIGNPGLKALLAATQPDPSCQALYFVSDGHGGHVFSRTAQEHEAAVERFRSLRRRQID